MSKLNKPELSIVMPVFNRKDLVRIMIDSIIANTYQDWELLAIDDGSTDGAYELLCEYSCNDSRIRTYLRTELPAGAQSCRNKGLELALGDYVIFFDSDDYIVPTCLQKRVDEINRRKDVDFLVFPAGIYEKQNSRNNMRWGVEVSKKKDFQSFISRENPFVVVTNIYNRISLLRCGAQWDTQVKSLQDSQFNIHILLNDMKYEYVKLDAPDYLYRLEGTGDSIQKHIHGLKHVDSHMYVLADTYRKVKDKYSDGYDRFLFRGALFLGHRLTAFSYDDCVMKELLAVVAKFDYRRSKLLSIMLCLYRKMNLLLPNLWVHRLIFLPYTINKRIRFFFNRK